MRLKGTTRRTSRIPSVSSCFAWTPVYVFSFVHVGDWRRLDGVHGSGTTRGAHDCRILFCSFLASFACSSVIERGILLPTCSL